MAAGWPTKVTYANGDVYSASDVNDTNGTLNYIDPTSATNNQVITRDSAAPGKVKWANSPANTLTTTGDLYYASAANTPARLAIGSTNQILSVVGGVPSWTNSSSFDSILTQETTGTWIRPYMTAIASATNPATTTAYVPIFLPTCSLDRIGMRSGGTVTTSGNTRLGLYNISATTGKPSTVVFDAGVVNVTATNTNYTITISQSINAGWYYLAFNTQTGSYTRSGTTDILPYFGNTQTTFDSTSAFTYFTESGITGAFATAGTVTETSGAKPLIGVRVA
jgi:hypothetical protein